MIEVWTIGQRSKLSLGALKRTKETFLSYGGDKEFVVKVTLVQTFTLIQMTLSLNLDTY